jgi:hypothetical protein
MGGANRAGKNALSDFIGVQNRNFDRQWILRMQIGGRI